MLDEVKALNAQAPKVVQQVANEPSLLKLKSDDGLRVNIEMDGSPLTAPLTVDRKKRLIELLNHIRPWLEGATAAPQATPAPQVVSRPASQPLQTPPLSAPVPHPAPELKPVPVTLTLNPQKPKITPLS